jgi:hypothetical protein
MPEPSKSNCIRNLIKKTLSAKLSRSQAKSLLGDDEKIFNSDFYRSTQERFALNVAEKALKR